tara:strand:- start:365 stop:673 length:309 start_codon:yes stop_codon:yes gene_type:complete
VKIFKDMNGIKEMLTRDSNDKLYALRIDSHDEARILLESLKEFKKMNVIGAPDSSTLEAAVREIEEKILTSKTKVAPPNPKREYMDKISGNGIHDAKNKNSL